ncbi:MAG TPA: LacI family DNA-binding transcriptional regulator [Nocardioidaceae bacterium]|nr:LacI family DNA-binding transcriptional regulator [Nocardioidaceae bacterium]
MPRVTLQTLADDLGVSRSTVSNAFGRPDQLSAELRERILTRARELRFTGPDPVARGLRRGRVGAVGVLVDQGLSYAFSDPAVVTNLDGLARELHAGGFGLLLHAGTGVRADAELVGRAAVDAWVIASLPRNDPSVQAAQAQSRPMVVLDQPTLPGVPTVGVDDEGGAAAAAEHLLGLGHRRLGVLTAPLQADGFQGIADANRQRRATYEVMAARLAGVRRVAVAAGLSWSDIPVVECARSDVDAGALGTWELLDRPRPPTAVLSFSDQLAIGALRAAAELGIPVPHRLSVVGFDDIASAATTEPALTTVAQPLRQRGEMAGELVRLLLDGRPAPDPPRLAVELVTRASTGAVPPGD